MVACKSFCGAPLNVNKPDIVSPLFDNLVAIDAATVVAKFSSPPSAADNSDRVSNTAGAELIKLLIPVLTKAVEATCVVLVPAVAVATVGVPRKSTDSIIELDLALIIGMFSFLVLGL